MVLPRKGTIFAVGFGIHTLSWNQQTGKTSSVSQRYCLGRFNCSDGVQTPKSFARKIFKAIETQDRYCLDIPDDYHYIDEELIEIFKLSMSTHLT